MTTPFRKFTATLAVVFAGSAFALAAPRIEETIMGPANQAGHFVVAERSGRVGFAGASGAGFSVRVDGVEGPIFDQLLRPTGEPVLVSNRTVIANATQTTSGQYNEGPLVFSRDGEHFAYLARRGKEIVVVHDGKEIARAPAERFNFQNNPISISPHGKYVYWVETDNATPRPQFRVMMNGQAGTWTGGITLANMVFSADESRFAYVATGRDGRQAVLIVDGKEAGYAGREPAFTADGKHLITAGSDGKQPAVLVDGKPVATGVRIGRSFVAPTGRRWATIVFRKNATHHEITALIVDGKEVPEAENAQAVWFSPDGKRYAAATRHYFNRGPDTMVVDGKRGAEFKSVSDRVDPFWSPDSTTLVYTAMSATEPVIVVVRGGKETPFSGTLLGDSVIFSERGGHYAFSKRDPRNQVAHIIDGETVSATMSPGTFTFSPDGTRHAYLADQKGAAGTLVVDGKPVPGLLAGYFGMWQSGNRPPVVVFSPNNKHFAALARAENGRELGLWVNDKVVHSTRSVFFPTFSPDSTHLYWAAEDTGGFAVYVDGQPAVTADRQFFNAVLGIFAVDRSGTLAFTGSDGTAVKRYRISPAAESNVASLMANGTTLAKAPAAPAPTPSPASPAAAAPKPTPSPAAVAATSAAPTTPVPTAATPAATPAKPSAPAAPAAPVSPLVWNDLVARPETRPARCTVKRDYQFQGGGNVRSGTTVEVLEASYGELVVGTPDGRITFGVKPDETDILAIANAEWAKLTPAQRELNYPTLLRRRELWPYRLKMTVPLELNDRTTRVGDVALLLDLEGSQFLVRLDGTNVLVNVEPQQTDIMAQARGLLLQEQGAPGRLMEEFSGKLVSAVNGRAMPLDVNARPKYVVLYRGAGWCGPCQTFSPHLVKALNDKGATAAEVVTLYVSADHSPAEARAYVSKLGIDWPTIYYKDRGQLPAFASLFGEAIPQLVVTDRHGKVLVDSARTGYERALAQLKQLP